MARKRKKISRPLKEKEIAESLIRHSGIQKATAEELKVTRQAIQDRIRRSEFLTEIYNQAREEFVHLCEGELLKLVKAGNLSAVIFGLKCQGKDFGWVERNELAVHARVEGQGVLVVNEEINIEEWNQLAIKQQRKIRELTDGKQESNDEN